MKPPTGPADSTPRPRSRRRGWIYGAGVPLLVAVISYVVGPIVVDWWTAKKPDKPESSNVVAPVQVGEGPQQTQTVQSGPGSTNIQVGRDVVIHSPSVEPKSKEPPDRASVKWATRLWNGETMTVRIGDIPSHARGRYIAGETYSLRFSKESCEWETIGPVVHHPTGLVERHVNRAGPSVKPYLDVKDSGTVTSECHSPLKNKMLILGVPVQFDRLGQLHAGGSNLITRQKDPPLGELVVPPSQP
jgi:hypothetical protein